MSAKKVKVTKESPSLALPVERSVCVYEGIEFDDVIDCTNPQPVKFILLTGKTGECEACGEVMFTTFFEGSWLCYGDIAEQAEEMVFSELENEEDF